MDWRERCEIKSNRESGWGRCDLVRIPNGAGGKGYLFEFKRVAELEKAAAAALAQIEKQAYFAVFEERGVEEALPDPKPELKASGAHGPLSQ